MIIQWIFGRVFTLQIHGCRSIFWEFYRRKFSARGGSSTQHPHIILKEPPKLLFLELPPVQQYFKITGCELYGFVGGFFGFVSISTLAWVAYDRYVVISNPLEAAQRVTKKRAVEHDCGYLYLESDRVSSTILRVGGIHSWRIPGKLVNRKYITISLLNGQ